MISLSLSYHTGFFFVNFCPCPAEEGGEREIVLVGTWWSARGSPPQLHWEKMTGSFLRTHATKIVSDPCLSHACVCQEYIHRDH